MKKISQVVVSLILSFAGLTAQTANYAQHSAVRKTYNIVSINNKSFYLVTDLAISSCCIGDAKLIAQDQSGKKLFEVAIAQMGAINQAEVKVLANKTLLVQVSSPRSFCDSGWPRTWLCNYDTLGNLLWTKIIAKEMGRCVAKNDGSFFIVRSDSLMHYAANGQVILKNAISGGQQQTGACLLANGNLFYSSFSPGTFKIVQIDTNGSTVASQFVAGTISEPVELSNGNIIGLQGQNILKVSASLTPISNSGTNSPNLSFKTFCYKADTIYAAGITATGALFYAAFDTNFNLFYTSNSSINSAIPSGICTGNDRNLRLISLASSEQTFTDTHTFSNFSQFGKGNAIIATKDIGVVDAQVLGYLVTHNSPPGQTLISCSVQATVKNYGNDTVKYFKLNSFAKVASISYCLIGMHQAFTATLPPGGTVVVSSKAFYMPPIPIAAIQNATHVVSQFCLYTSVPDSTIDYEVSNNSACKNFTFSLLQTGIEEAVAENKISIYPNPVSNKLQINSDETIRALKIYNSIGVEVFSSSNETKTLEIDCSGFVPGVYSISCKVGEAWQRKKIVVK